MSDLRRKAVVEETSRFEQQSPALLSEDRDTVDYLRSQLDKLCSDIADNFALYDSKSRPRKAFILSTLMRYSCLGCIAKVFKQPYQWNDVDAIYRENHRLAVNMLSEYLQHYLIAKGFNVLVQDEVEGDYGRVDVLVRPISGGVLVKLGSAEIIVEVKTGKSLSYDQIFRYFLGRPNATMIVWRVKTRQIFKIDQERMCQILPVYLKAIINRGTRLLREEKRVSCSHNPVKVEPYVITNPQEVIGDFLSALTETLPDITETVLEVLKSLTPV